MSAQIIRFVPKPKPPGLAEVLAHLVLASWGWPVAASQPQTFAADTLRPCDSEPDSAA